MRFVLATLGTRGDIEPCAAIGRELQRRGHDVHMAVPPNYVGFVESAGLAAVGHGPDQVRQNADIARKYGTTPNPAVMLWEIFRDITQLWPGLGTALTALADGADLLLTDAGEQGLAANVAEYYDIPYAAVHIYPIAPDKTHSPITKAAEYAQRRELGLSAEPGPSTPQPLEIQAYDELFFPELAAEWAKCGVRRPFVGGLTLELPTEIDEEVSSWIAAGTPPIYFGFGSSARVAFSADVIAMSAACAQLGERALICSGVSDLTDLPQFEHVKVVSAVNHAAVFPSCRAVVHHGGPGTTFAGIRAGVPTLALAVSVDQPMWAAAVNRLGVGIGRRFMDTTPDSLVADLRSILTPRCVARTREVAAEMATPAESAAIAADLLEDAVRHGASADGRTPRTAE
ncbi:glycosyltransferase [Mycobacterium nebraskense]|uniref:Glycosyltransferase n=1 Tax=Mycobacterium nebraskense TaxID=244292 RepID=A0A0F5N5V9_9MYCO|nr:glycosyltransferase [Mycobacterium nebraskense]KKC02240.1 glycosyltransferase [Mycobacterium nebraskense]KLO32958.1 glycosyltransferase [Mycobacterium nebraskense]MCV7117165.1 glycosyltransferase [Mycobacterium nebraskense]ORW23550.1 glycosyltransferase [Mycobacterium nebraskense]